MQQGKTTRHSSSLYTYMILHSIGQYRECWPSIISLQIISHFCRSDFEELFDIIITNALKPGFFSLVPQQRPFRTLGEELTDISHDSEIICSSYAVCMYVMKLDVLYLLSLYYYSVSSVFKFTLLLKQFPSFKMNIYIFAFSRRFYPKRLTVHSGYTFVLSVCCSLGIEPTTFALLTQCSTTEPQEHEQTTELN